MQRFADRREAGVLLADALDRLNPEHPVVLALPRGGVPVAMPVAKQLGAPLDLLMVRKIGMPGHEEYAAGALVDGFEPHVFFNEYALKAAGLTEADFDKAIAQKLSEIEARRSRYLGDREAIPLEGRTAIVVDDGIATGATVKAALYAVNARQPSKVVLAIPVAPADTVAELRAFVDEIVCLVQPAPFYAVGAHYDRFEQVSDADVVAMMKEAAAAVKEEESQ